MKLMLTAFGITDRHTGIGDSSSLFHLMPPVNMRAVADKFLPDYTMLLLCEKLIMDEISFELLSEKSHPLYSYVAETLNVLHSEGFIELVNFNHIMSKREALLQKMTENDLIKSDIWINTLKDSLKIWDDFSQRTERFVSSEYGQRTLRTWVDSNLHRRLSSERPKEAAQLQRDLQRLLTTKSGAISHNERLHFASHAAYNIPWIHG